MIELQSDKRTMRIYGKIIATERFDSMTLVSIEGGHAVWASETPEEIEAKMDPWNRGKPKQTGVFLVKTTDKVITVRLWDGRSWNDNTPVESWIEVPL